MSRGKPTIWDCRHNGPIEAVSTEGGKRARCLVCGAVGPVRAEAKEAVLALMAEARGRGVA
jgi:hypothetical protein